MVELAEEEDEVGDRFGVDGGVEDAERTGGDGDGVVELTKPKSQSRSDEICVGGGLDG